MFHDDKSQPHPLTHPAGQAAELAEFGPVSEGFPGAHKTASELTGRK